MIRLRIKSCVSPLTRKKIDIEFCNNEAGTCRSSVINGNAGTMMSRQNANQQTIGMSKIRFASGLCDHSDDISISIPFQDMDCKYGYFWRDDFKGCIPLMVGYHKQAMAVK